MRRIFTATCLLLAATGCTVGQENGNDLRIMPPPALVQQHWKVTQQRNEGPVSVCTISAGEMDVTQRVQNGAASVQVASNYHLNPGDLYRLTIGGMTYETRDQWFSPAESQTIVDAFMHAPGVYTEVAEMQLPGRGQTYHFLTNHIPLADFPARYQDCRNFLHLS